MERVKCSLCRSDQPIPYLTTSDRFGGGLFTLSKCNNCGLIYLTPRPSPNELDDYYPNSYEAYHLNGSANHRNNRLNPQFLRTLLRYVELSHPIKGKLLDVGCATGDFLNYARNNGWQVLGIEIIEKAAAIARNQYQLDVLNSDLESANITPSSIDVVTLWDVLEHLPDPLTAMKKLHEILKPSGYVLFSIPNLNSFDRKIFETQWIGWDPPRHFNLFTEETIQRLLSTSGFSIVNRKCLTGGKGTFRLSLDRVIEKHPRYRWVKSFYPILELILWPYRQISYLTLKGPIMFYTAQKI